jgi:uncharacterized membrane protein
MNKIVYFVFFLYLAVVYACEIADLEIRDVTEVECASIQTLYEQKGSNGAQGVLDAVLTYQRTKCFSSMLAMLFM